MSTLSVANLVNITSINIANDFTIANTLSVGNSTIGTFFAANGNVGIGNNTPSNKLHVTGSAYVNGSIYAGSNNISIEPSGIRSRTGSGNYSYRVVPGGGSDANSGILQFTNAVENAQWGSIYHNSAAMAIISNISGASLLLGANNATNIMVAANGNVGIGNTSPAEKFVVQSTGGQVATFFNPSSNVNSWIGFNTATGSTTYGIDSDNIAYIYNGFAFKIFTNGANERMRIAANGNVGIGTNTPSASLNIRSSGQDAKNLVLGSDTTDNANVAILFHPRQVFMASPIAKIVGQLGYGLSGQEAGDLVFHTTTGGTSYERMRIDSSGRIAIGNSSASGKFFLQTSATNDGIKITDGTVSTVLYSTSSSSGSVGTVSNHGFGIYSNNVLRMTFDANGNIGMGTSPSIFKVDIGGTIRALSSSEGFTTTGDTIGRDLVAGKNDLATCIGYAGSDAMVQGTNFTLSSTPHLSLQPYGGQVKTPAQAYAEATCSSGYSFGSGASRTLMVWDSVTVNTGNCMNNTNGRFTCPVSGVYLVTATAIVQTASSTGSDYRMALNKNGSQVTNAVTTKQGGYPSIVFSQMVYANAGDYFTTTLWNDGGTGSTQNDASFTRFTCRLMG